MKAIVFLASGGGGNLRFIVRSIEEGILGDYDVTGVIADRECASLRFAEEYGIPAYRVEYSTENPDNLREKLREFDPAIIVTNIHKILDHETVRLFRGRLINLHYSLLPAFKGFIGAESVRQALRVGCKFVGTTVHYVEEEVDSGSIISQSALPVSGGEAFEEVMNNVFRAGCINLLNAIQLLDGREVRRPAEPYLLAGGTVFSPSLTFDTDAFTEGFWDSVR